MTEAVDSSTGAERWVARYHGGDQSSEVPRAIAVTPDGSTVLVAGASNGYFATIAYSISTGEQRWGARFGTGADTVGGVALSTDGATAYVTGQVYLATFDWATVAYDIASGRRIWVATLDGPSTFTTSPRRYASVPAGGSSTWPVALKIPATTSWLRSTHRPADVGWA